MGAHGYRRQGGKDRYYVISDQGDSVHNQTVIVRFDGIQPDMPGDNLCFTFLSHFIGADGRDYVKSSWIGIVGLIKAGVNLDMVQIVGPDTVRGYTTGRIL